MAENSVENDLFARKTTRYLLIIEIASLLVAFILLFFNVALGAFVLATLTLLVFIGIFLWLYIRYGAFPIVREKNSLQGKASDLQSHIKEEASRINQATQKQNQLFEAEKSEIDSTLEKLQQAYVQNGLANTRIDSAKIPSIGPKLKERLSSHSIATAADVNQNIKSIEGFGEAKVQVLLSWQRSIYEELVRSKPIALPNEILDNIKQKFSKLQEENDIAYGNAEKNKQEFEESLKAIQPRLKQLTSVTFITYLSTTFASQKTISFLILFILVLIQCVLGVSTGAATIAASLPTLTFTPTQTFTPTSTFAPIQTFTPTSTFTPTITNTPTITLTSTITSTPTITFTPTITITPTATLPANVTGCIPKTTTRETGLVIGVIDGDTIDVRINNQVYRVRYIGIDTPEQNEIFYSQATAYNQKLVSGQTVTLVKDVSETDRFDRLLRYIIVGERFVNHEIVEQGYAHASAYPPDIACAETFVEAQRYAQAGKLGLWMPTATAYIPPAGGGGRGGNCHPSYPGVCIPPPPPDLDCKDISYRRFQVLSPDPHNFDDDSDGIGCES